MNFKIVQQTFAELWQKAYPKSTPPKIEWREEEIASGDGYRIFTENGTLIFAVPRLRCALYAVYRFFEVFANVAYFWDADIFPEHKSPPTFENIDLRETPRMEWRGIRYFAHRGLYRFNAEMWNFDDWKREIDWLLKMRLNFFMLRIGIGDLFSKAFPEIVPQDAEPFVGEAYDDRRDWLTAAERADLRKKVLDYAHERDLIHPEDVGTMSHWYSRTPKEFLDTVKPDFVPQATMGYSEPSGLVWDIRQDKYLDAYWKLTEAHIKYYGGAPQLFHTIGLAERGCFEDREKNLDFKLFTYRRIIEKMREHYPEIPLLVASWDFVCTWRPEEVDRLFSMLDPKTTLIFDYTVDIAAEPGGDIPVLPALKKFPWIFGIFGAYNASTEVRGRYDLVRERWAKAADDPLCRGIAYWPENSHGDTLMLDFFPRLAWDPSLTIERHLPEFCARRYGKNAADFLRLWQLLLPASQYPGWATWWAKTSRKIIYPDMYFALCRFEAVRDSNPECFEEDAKALAPFAADLEKILRSRKIPTTEIERRDILDIKRTALARLLEYHLARLALGDDSAPRNLRRLAKKLTALLGTSAEFSLEASIEKVGGRSARETIYHNADNGYCRSFVYELSRDAYEKELDALLTKLSREKKTRP